MLRDLGMVTKQLALNSRLSGLGQETDCMSLVNRAGSVSEISPCHPFFIKILMCSYKKAG